MITNPARIVQGLFLVILHIFLVYNINLQSVWIYDSIACLVLLGLFMLLHKRFRFSSLDSFLFGGILVMHLAGGLGAYSRIEYYDKMIHFSAAFVGVWILSRPLMRLLHIKRTTPFFILVLVSFIVLAGVILEIFEFSSAALLGTKEGFFSPQDFIGEGPEDYYQDTITDLMANIAGSIVGVVIVYVFKNSFFYHK